MALTLLQHPVAADTITMLRDKTTQPPEMRVQLHRLAVVLATTATTTLQTERVEVATPMQEDGYGDVLTGQHALVPIMRAGAGMLDAFQLLLPKALIWHVFMHRDHDTHEPIWEGSKVPEPAPEVEVCFALDPMLATGGSASATLTHLKERGVKKIIFVGVVGCPEGAARLEADHPDVPVIMGVMDGGLNDDAYILGKGGGMGDMGDRVYPDVPA